MNELPSIVNAQCHLCPKTNLLLTRHLVGDTRQWVSAIKMMQGSLFLPGDRQINVSQLSLVATSQDLWDLQDPGRVGGNLQRYKLQAMVPCRVCIEQGLGLG
jgi:hypothetical protein